MTLYRNSKVDVYYGDGEADFKQPYEVRIADGSIVLSYKVEGITVFYEGKEIGDGHFILKSTNVNGKGTLHKVPEDDVLEGWWFEDGSEGMWRVYLEE